MTFQFSIQPYPLPLLAFINVNTFHIVLLRKFVGKYKRNNSELNVPC